VKFDISADGILALHAGGVTELVLNQMLRAGTRQKYDASFGVATGTFPVKDAAGKTVRFSAWIKTDSVLNGYAGLWWRVDGPGKGTDRPQLAFDNSEARFIDSKPDAGNGTIRGTTGTTPWTRYQFELPVGKTASNINFGVLFTGTGTVWVDSLKIELDGEPYSNPQFDFDSESATAKGFYTGGTGYKVGIDNKTSYTGQQSLKMLFVGDGAVPGAPGTSVQPVAALESMLWVLKTPQTGRTHATISERGDEMTDCYGCLLPWRAAVCHALTSPLSYFTFCWHRKLLAGLLTN
jgi:hypothetical protein